MSATPDQLGRRLRDMRISLTDRCNFRCRYCMPREAFGSGHVFAAHGALLSFGEIAEIVQAGVDLGVRKVRLTGGEPLLRTGVVDLVRQLRVLAPTVDLAMTTNGVLLPRLAAPLKEAGLDRLTVSLDSLDEKTFRDMADSNFTPRDVLAGITAAESAGFRSVKINCVIKAGVNEPSILELAQHFRRTKHVLRFIEYMDVGSTNDWRRHHVVTADHIRDVLKLATRSSSHQPTPAARSPPDTVTSTAEGRSASSRR